MDRPTPESDAQTDAGEDLELLRSVALAAGHQALVMREAGLTTQLKADKSPVTDADMALDAFLKSELRAARPDYGWLSEESVDHTDRLGRRRVFVVDPIDGTRAFARGKPWWTVCVAVVEHGQPLAGVVWAPDRAELYEATAGGGARLNGGPIHASARDSLDGCAMLADAAMFTHPEWREPWPTMRVESRNSIAYRLCSVASGEFDAALDLWPKSEWDLAASALIAAEAGCAVTDDRGRRLSYNRVVTRSTGLVCAGPALHELILRRLAVIAAPD